MFCRTYSRIDATQETNNYVQVMLIIPCASTCVAALSARAFDQSARTVPSASYPLGIVTHATNQTMDTHTPSRYNTQTSLSWKATNYRILWEGSPLYILWTPSPFFLIFVMFRHRCSSFQLIYARVRFHSRQISLSRPWSQVSSIS